MGETSTAGRRSPRRRSRVRRRTAKGRRRHRTRLALLVLAWSIVPIACYPLIVAVANAPRDDDGNIDITAETLPMAEFLGGLAAAGGCVLASHRFRG